MRSRRTAAKLIDLVAFGGFVSIGDRLGGSAWTGLALGAAYLLAGDALGMSAKSWLGLRVVDARSGRRCALASSALRNAPWLVAPICRAAVTSFAGQGAALLDGAALPTSVAVARGVVGCVGLAIGVSLWVGLGDGDGRHWADVLARTTVVRAGAPVTRARTSPAATRSTMPVAAVPDRDAVDFDDADHEATPRGTARPPAQS